jgi:hypothetical protein
LNDLGGFCISGFSALSRQRLNANNQSIKLGRVVRFVGFSRFDLAYDLRREFGQRLALCCAPIRA